MALPCSRHMALRVALPMHTPFGSGWAPFRPSTQAGNGRSVPRLPYLWLRRSAAGVGTGPGEVDAQDDPPLALHRRPVVVPVGVLTGDPPVVIDEDLHSIG